MIPMEALGPSWSVDPNWKNTGSLAQLARAQISFNSRRAEPIRTWPTPPLEKGELLFPHVAQDGKSGFTREVPETSAHIYIYIYYVFWCSRAFQLFLRLLCVCVCVLHACF